MKTKRIFIQLCFLLSIVVLSGFTVKPLNSAFTVSLSNAPVYGNTEYDLIVSYASGNNAYQVSNYTGFFFISASAKDAVPGQNTVFRIKTYPMVTHIAGNVIALTCPSSCSSSGNQYFGF